MHDEFLRLLESYASRSTAECLACAGWQVYTGPVKAGNYGSKDFLQAQDLTTGETEYFRFQFL